MYKKTYKNSKIIIIIFMFILGNATGLPFVYFMKKLNIGSFIFGSVFLLIFITISVVKLGNVKMHNVTITEKGISTFAWRPSVMINLKWKNIREISIKRVKYIFCEIIIHTINDEEFIIYRINTNPNLLEKYINEALSVRKINEKTGDSGAVEKVFFREEVDKKRIIR